MLHRSVILVVAAIVSAPAAAEVVSSSDSGFALQSTASVPVAPDVVWADLVAPAKWWDPEHTWSGKASNLYLDPQATGCFCELLGSGEPGSVDPGLVGPGRPRGSVEHLHIVHVLPGRLLRMTGGLGPLQSEPVGAVLTIALESAGEGTRIRFEYKVSGLVTIKGGDIAPAVDGVLSAQLARLAALPHGSAPARDTGSENPR